MKRIFFSFLIAGAMALQACAQPVSATAILEEAYKQAAKENKNVFILFHASWCGWCHKMDTAMNDPACKKTFDDNYVIRHLVVYESEANKKLENPGALELLTKFKGNEQGIPYWLIFDASGNLLADSKARPEGVTDLSVGESVGCPATEKEVEYFISVLKKTTRIKVSDEQLELIRKRFRKNEQ
jgi:thioredoxin-related protein